MDTRKKIIVLVGGAGNSGKEFVSLCNDHSSDDYIIKRYSDIAFIFKEGVQRCLFIDDGTDLTDADLVYFRGTSAEHIRHAVALFLNHNGVPMVNSESTNFQTTTKLEQYSALALAGLPIPDSVFVNKPEYYQQAFDLLGTAFPIVAKSISGSNGNDNQLVRSEEELEQLDMPLPIFQKFIPNTFDYRVIVAGDHVALSYKRIRSANKDDYKNNISQGGTREAAELSEELQEIAVRAAQTIGREFTGLDIMPNAETGEHVILEVNFNFGTPHFKDVTIEQGYYEDITRYLRGLAR
jgi:RimK family alpha-L-glutamate ligase